MRSEFEKLPSIKTFLMSFEYDEKSGEYIRSGSYYQPDYSLGFFNGAWYAFQEQQKKIDKIGVVLNKIYSETEGDNDLLMHYLDEIQELLK